MKKTLALLVALGLGIGAFAQEWVEVKPNVDNQIFNHLAVGASLGLDGMGIHVATTLTPYVQLKAGFSGFFPVKLSVPDVNSTSLVTVPSEIEIGGEKRKLDNLSFGVGMNLGGGQLMADIFPSKKTIFHFTVGAYFTSPKFVSIDVDASTMLKPDEYDGSGSVYGIVLNPDDPQHTNITPNKQGHFLIDVKNWAVRPYVGIGLGRPIDPNRRVRFSLDLGAMFWGSPTVQSYDFSDPKKPNGTVVAVTKENLEKNSQLSRMGTALDLVSGFQVMPVVRFNLYVRIF